MISTFSLTATADVPLKMTLLLYSTESDANHVASSHEPLAGNVKCLRPGDFFVISSLTMIKCILQFNCSAYAYDIDNLAC